MRLTRTHFKVELWTESVTPLNRFIWDTDPLANQIFAGYEMHIVIYKPVWTGN